MAQDPQRNVCEEKYFCFGIEIQDTEEKSDLRLKEAEHVILSPNEGPAAVDKAG